MASGGWLVVFGEHVIDHLWVLACPMLLFGPPLLYRRYGVRAVVGPRNEAR